MQLIRIFLSVIVGYHLLHTGVVFGMEISSGMVLAGMRDLLWIVLCAVVVVWQYRARPHKIPRSVRIGGGLLLLLIGWSIGRSFIQGVDLMSILVGVKYDLFPLVLLYSGMRLGASKNRQDKKLLNHQTVEWLVTVLWITLLAGVVWQFGKIARPGFFEWLGYGPIGDYVQGSNPPIYYRTGPGGRMRYQGIFAGPNNLGYRLVAVGGLVTRICFGREFALSKTQKLLLGLLFFTALVGTLSRGAIVGFGAELLIGGIVLWPHLRKWIVGCLFIGILGVGGLSILKPGSTIGHLVAWGDGVDAFMQNPLGYGLGSAGPAVHYQGVYLPENHYLQLLLDIGLPGLFLWLLTLVVLLRPVVRMALYKKSYYQTVTFLLVCGLIGLLVEGLFLHTFEDSMISYMLLIPLGILAGLNQG